MTKQYAPKDTVFYESMCECGHSKTYHKTDWLGRDRECEECECPKFKFETTHTLTYFAGGGKIVKDPNGTILEDTREKVYRSDGAIVKKDKEAKA